MKLVRYGNAGQEKPGIIDPEGNIINSNAPKPSDKRLINLFNEQNI